MMDIVLNGKPFEGEIAGDNLGSLLDAIRPGFPSGHIVSFLFVDGQELLQSDVDALRQVGLNNVQEVNIQTASLKGEIQKGLSEVVTFLDDMLPVMEDSALQISIGEVHKASESLSSCFEGLGMVLRNMEQLYSAFPMVKMKIQEEEFDIFRSLNDADLVGTIEAFKAQEWTTVGARIQDHLIPTLSPWSQIINRSCERLAADTQA